MPEAKLRTLLRRCKFRSHTLSFWSRGAFLNSWHKQNLVYFVKNITYSRLQKNVQEVEMLFVTVEELINLFDFVDICVGSFALLNVFATFAYHLRGKVLLFDNFSIIFSNVFAFVFSGVIWRTSLYIRQITGDSWLWHSFYEFQQMRCNLPEVKKTPVIETAVYWQIHYIWELESYYVCHH